MTHEQAIQNLYRFSRLEVDRSKAIHDALLALVSVEKISLTQEEYEGALVALGEMLSMATENEGQRIKQALKAKVVFEAKETFKKEHSKLFETVVK